MNIKKVFAALAAWAVVLSGTAGMLPETFVPASVLTVRAKTYDGLTYVVLDDGTVEITGCDDGLITLEIPGEIEGKAVTGIANGAFAHCTSLTSVTIPDSVTSIGIDAFAICTSLTSVTIPNSVTNIGRYAFSGCTSLTSITIPNSVTSIGIDAFYGCTSLTDITIPDSITSLGYGVFYDTAWYNAQPDGLVYAGKWLYTYKGEMSDNYTAVLRAGTVGIADSALADCTGLTSITIPDSVTSIGYGAFSRCTSLADITIPDSVTSIGGHAFYGCTDLADISIPDGVTSIGGGAFGGCTSLADISIPDSVTSIGSNAFFDTAWYDAQPDGLVYAGKWLYKYKGEMPDNCTAALYAGTLGIAGDAFSGCTGLTSIIIPNSVMSIGVSAFIGCTSLTDILIPDSVTSIECATFYECMSLTDIIIPDSVTNIDNGAFRYCKSLTNITILNPDCKIEDQASTFCNDKECSDEDDSVTYLYTGTITGYEGSTAQAYAKKYNRTFVSLGEAPAKLQYGDADESGEVDIGDVIALCKASMGTFTLTAQGIRNGDVNGDGKTDTTDASCILQSLIGLFELPN